MVDAEFSGVSQPSNEKQVTLKVGLLGDSQIGKTSLMVKYVEGSFEDSYIETLGVHFMDKIITLKNNKITFNIWDLGGQKTFLSMLPLVCKDAVVILFMFDLTKRGSLASVKDWYRQARAQNKTFTPFLVGTKFDKFKEFDQSEQVELTNLAKKYATAMKSPLIFCSSQNSQNVNEIFKIVLCKAFKLKCNLPQVSEPGQAILEYANVTK